MTVLIKACLMSSNYRIFDWSILIIKINSTIQFILYHNSGEISVAVIFLWHQMSLYKVCMEGIEAHTQLQVTK